MSKILIFCSLFIYASSQVFVPGRIPRTGPIKPMPLTPCGNPQLISNPIIGCLDPVISSYGTITEVPLNLGSFLPASTLALTNPILPASPLALTNPILPASTLALTNPILPASTLPLANPFLPAASPVSAYMPISPLLPPASPCNNRCQYLKKIPIPPPCI